MTRLTSLTAVVLAAAACASPPTGPAFAGHNNGPAGGISLLVRNNRCFGGHCAPVRVLAFPEVGNGGPVLWKVDLGVSTTEEACFTFPDSSVRYIIGPADTIVTIWRPSTPVALNVVPAEVTLFDLGPTSQAFTPSSAAGWQVSLPDTKVQSASRCVPTD
jgi:hypothetical protein